MQTNTKMFMQRDNQSNRCSKQFCPIKIWKSVRVWIGWENNRPIKSVDAVVKEHRLFIVFLVLVKNQVVKRKTYTYNTSMQYLFFGNLLLKHSQTYILWLIKMD